MDTCGHDLAGAPLRLVTDPIPAVLLEQSRTAALFIERAIGFKVDGTVDTLPLVDHYLQQVREDARDRPELTELVSVAVAAYVIEVVLNRFVDATFEGETDQPLSWSVQFPAQALSFHPVAMVAEVVLASGQEGAMFRVPTEKQHLLEAALEAEGEVDDDFYFSLTGRLEVLETCLEALGRERGFSPDELPDELLN